MAVTAHRGPDQKAQPDVDAKNKEPPQMRYDPGAACGESIPDLFRGKDKSQYK